MPIASREFRELRLERISRDFGQVRALRDVSLTVGRGEFVALLGPSGCGKSTALNCIAGLLQVTDGAIWLDERRLDEAGPEDRGFGMVFQNYALFPHMTVRRNVGFGLVTQRRPKAEIARRVDQALALVRLETQADKLPGQLSGGQQQRVAIARAIVVEPPLVLMDEPLSNLDAKLRLEMRAEIRRIHTMLGLLDDLCDARPGGGAVAGRPHPGDDRRPDASDSARRRNSTRGRRMPMSPSSWATATCSACRAETTADGLAVTIGAARLQATPMDAVGGAAVAAIRPDDLRPTERWTDLGDGGDRRVPRPRLLRRGTRRRRHRAVFSLSDAGEPGRAGSPGGTARPRAGLRRMSVGTMSLRRRLRERGLDAVTLLVLPGVVFVLALFIYPFLYGLVLSFTPKEGGWLANYQKFFSDPFLYDTIYLTLQIAVPVTLLNTVLSVPVALRVRLLKRQRLLTTILVIPITLGTVMVAEGLLTYLGPRGWLNRFLLEVGIADSPVRLIHNYWGVMLSLVINGFPFTFLLTLSYVTGIDPSLEQAGAMLGARARQRFFRILLPLLAPGLAITLALSFVQAFTVFPSAVLLGAPAGPTRVISIVAYQAAFEQYDYSLASAIAMLMAGVQVIIIVALLGARTLVFRGPASTGKG